MAELKLVLVTPEKTVFDRPVASVRVPLFDGSIGIYPSRAPLVGRLGIGELQLKSPSGEIEGIFIDGGFVQVKGAVISVLTFSAMPTAELSRKSAAQALDDARAERARSDEEYVGTARRLERARRMLALARRD
ncbi:MAG: F0F1 ATP synthase subunit epsilon [Planctomycetota bacterium]